MLMMFARSWLLESSIRRDASITHHRRNHHRTRSVSTASAERCIVLGLICFLTTVLTSTLGNVTAVQKDPVIIFVRMCAVLKRSGFIGVSVINVDGDVCNVMM